MNKPNALQLRWNWYEAGRNGWKPCATEAIKDFLLWLYSEGGEVICKKFARDGRMSNFPERREG